MNLKDIAETLAFKETVGVDLPDTEITGGYAGDLLSDVMANAREGDIWVTLMTHQNIVAVAVLKSIAAIVLVRGREPESQAREKAKEEGLPIFATEMSAFEVAGNLYSLGIKG